MLFGWRRKRFANNFCVPNVLVFGSLHGKRNSFSLAIVCLEPIQAQNGSIFAEYTEILGADIILCPAFNNTKNVLVFCFLTIHALSLRRLKYFNFFQSWSYCCGQQNLFPRGSPILLFSFWLVRTFICWPVDHQQSVKQCQLETMAAAKRTKCSLPVVEKRAHCLWPTECTNF